MREKLQSVIEKPIFEIGVIAVIVASALSFGVRTFSLDPPVMAVINAFDYFVTVFFAIEVSLRFLAEAEKKHFFKRGWNIFDTLIVVLSLIPLPDGEYVLLARLLRIVRVLRLVSFIPELRQIVEALFKAIPRLGYVALLIFIVFYIYAVVGSLMFSKVNEDLWGNIGSAMLTLFRVMTFEDWTDVMYATLNLYAWAWLYYLSFILVVSFALLNTMIGVIVQSMEDVSDSKARTEINARLDTIERLLRDGQDKNRPPDPAKQSPDS